MSSPNSTSRAGDSSPATRGPNAPVTQAKSSGVNVMNRAPSTPPATVPMPPATIAARKNSDRSKPN